MSCSEQITKIKDLVNKIREAVDRGNKKNIESTIQNFVEGSGYYKHTKAAGYTKVLTHEIKRLC